MTTKPQPSSTATAVTTQRNAKAVTNKKKPSFLDNLKSLKLFFKDDDVQHDYLQNAAFETQQYKRLVKKVWIQSIIIIALVVLLILAIPILQPIDKFFSLSPSKDVAPLIALNEPNMTNQAILSWTTTSITEIMTLGFGDFDSQLIRQKKRFTPEGWQSFLMAIRDQNIRSAFKDRQLVLTTVPANTALISAQGIDVDGQYIWIVELPIILAYETNNEVTKREKSVVQLTIVRVPPSENIQGIAIKTWKRA